MFNKVMNFSEFSQSVPENEATICGAKIAWKDTGTAKGRGVFTLEDIAAGEVIEIAPVLPMASHNIPDDGGVPDGYLLDWDADEEGAEHALALGYVALYNHSRTGANIELENDYEAMTITSRAIRPIKAGEEILWNYDCDIWFEEE